MAKVQIFSLGNLGCCCGSSPPAGCPCSACEIPIEPLTISYNGTLSGSTTMPAPLSCTVAWQGTLPEPHAPGTIAVAFHCIGGAWELDFDDGTNACSVTQSSSNVTFSCSPLSFTLTLVAFGAAPCDFMMNGMYGYTSISITP